MTELNFVSGTLVLALGMVMGSFANVLIHRLPRMVMAAAEPTQEAPTPYDISQPASHCPNCQTPLRAWHNIPILSFIWLRGRCSFCQHPIGWIYPAIEVATGLLWLACAWHWGLTLNALCWAWFATSLLALAVIDWQTALLPDDLTQTLLWVGLIASTNQWIALPLEDAVWGAALGYASLWLVASVFEKITQQEGMGAGDFKLLAAIGAWLGPLPLIPVVLLASIAGVVVGLALKANDQLLKGGYLPFGPFLASAAGLIMVLDPHRVMRWIGW
jgi:leader peptidase (prepilin peptidase)/N-methyltransferase